MLRLVGERRQEFWQGKLWLLHHANASADNALSVLQFLAEKNIAVLEQRPYSPDLTPRDFFLFPKAQGGHKGARFEDEQATKKGVTTKLRVITKESFQQCIEAWQRRMEKCIRLKEDFFEGKTM